MDGVAFYGLLTPKLMLMTVTFALFVLKNHK